MLIQWKSVLTKRQTVSLSTDFLDQFGISRGIKLRSLKLLEKAGLILLSKASGKSLRITLFSYPTKQNSMDPYHRGVITEPQHLFFLPPLIDFHTQSNLVIGHLKAYEDYHASSKEPYLEAVAFRLRVFAEWKCC